MSARVRLLGLIVAFWQVVNGTTINEPLNYTEIFATYYDPVSKHQFRLSSVENMLTNTTEYATKSTLSPGQIKIIRRIGFRSNGCTCQTLTCGCCLGINLNQFNFNREGCMNFTYDPSEFAVTMDMFMNNNNVLSNTFSARDPPPVCIPVPIPYIPIQVDACVRIFNVYTPGQNLHMCLDFETRIQSATILILHFDCMRMGVNGVALVKPGDNGGLPTSTEIDVDPDIYDDVTEIKLNSNDTVV